MSRYLSWVAIAAAILETLAFGRGVLSALVVPTGAWWSCVRARVAYQDVVNTRERSGRIAAEGDSRSSALTELIAKTLCDSDATM